MIWRLSSKISGHFQKPGNTNTKDRLTYFKLKDILQYANQVFF